MTNQNPNMPQEQEAFIPPYYMLILSIVAFLVAIVVALTQPTFTVVGWGALGIAILSLVAWIFMDPQQAKAVFTGRTARFGGTSILVTAVFLAALIGIYAIIRDQNWRIDLTQSDQYSLTDEARKAIAGLGADPKLPKVQILAFYDATQVSRRDQDSLLFEDYAKTSGGKISYEFIDPVRNPAQANQYQVERSGAISVVRIKDDGQPDIENAQLVSFFSQDEITNAILRVSASGDFRAYILSVDDGLKLSDMSTISEDLTQQLNWKTDEVTFFDLNSPNSEINLDDPAINGRVLVIPGGSKPLTDDEMSFLANYLDKGGDLVILAAPNTNEDQTSLATSDNLSTYLYEKFGVRFAKDIVLDATLAAGSPQTPAATTFDSAHLITSRFPSNQYFVLFNLPHSIEVSPTLPADVTVTELIKSGDTSYSKTDVTAVMNNEVAQADTDPKGPFVMGAAAENTQTGARVVLFGSVDVFADLLGQQIVNNVIGELSLIWATRFDEYFSTVNILSSAKPQDAPVFASDQIIRNVNLLTIIVLPFGVLAIGFLVWWNTRERAVRSASPNQES